jgi:glycosyltransferase involved in cell wall biosynthesis
MSEQQLVSVIIPLYNTEKYIEETINSILKQTYTQLEIVVVDDGSTDQSSTIVKQLQEKYPRIVRYIYQENSGVAVARNTGIEHAKGEYIAFLDSDDLWHTTKIEKQMESIHTNKMDACYCGYMHYYEETSEEVKHLTNFIKGDIATAFLTHQVLAQTSTWVIKRDILMNHHIRFTPGCSWGEDLEFFFKVMSVTNICYVNDYLTYYRILPDGNLSSKYKQYTLKTTKELEVFMRMMDWTKRNKKDSPKTNNHELTEAFDKYLLPYTVINNACIYIKAHKQLEEKEVAHIKSDLKKYCQNFRFHNGKRSIKLYLMLWFVRLKVMFA